MYVRTDVFMDGRTGGLLELLSQLKMIIFGKIYPGTKSTINQQVFKIFSFFCSIRSAITSFVHLWVNIDPRCYKQSQKSQLIALGPQKSKL